MARRFALLFALALLSSIQVFGQEEPEKKEIEPKQIVAPTERLSKRIFLVIDVSSSMDHPDRVKQVLKLVRHVTEQPIDDYELAIVVFNDDSERWPGVKDADDNKNPIPWGWARLPSATTIDTAQKWLSEQKPRGGTDPERGFEVALREKRSDMSIVFVTDAGYGRDSLERQIDRLQAERRAKGLGDAVIMAYGLGVMSQDEKAHMKQLGTKWKGGFFWEPSPSSTPSSSSTTGPLVPWHPPHLPHVAPIATPVPAQEPD